VPTIEPITDIALKKSLIENKTINDKIDKIATPRSAPAEGIELVPEEAPKRGPVTDFKY
jgi:hypothetical protein